MVEVHLAFVMLTALAVLYSDEQGLMWFLGRKETLPEKRVELLHILVSVGLAGIIATGGFMFVDRMDYLLGQPVFLVKMGFVAALVVNGFFIGKIARLASEKPFAALSAGERRATLISGAVSLTGWVGAVVLGFVLSS